MSQEITVILRMIYGEVLRAKTLQQIKARIKSLMEEEDVAYVEKMLREELDSPKEQK